MSRSRVRAVAPGRVNLIGDHTDYMDGVVLPMAIQLATTVEGDRVGSRIELRSEGFDEPLSLQLPVDDPAGVEPAWGRYVAGVAAELDPPVGLRGTVTSTLPPGSGLSSSAALEVAVALALGASTEPVELAGLTQRAEQRATGVPCGIMDQLASAAGRAGHALLIDCATTSIDHVPIPDDAAWWVLHSGQPRQLAASGYAQRRAECEAARDAVGPLPEASLDVIEALEDPVLRARARHVRTECDRVHLAADALRAGELDRVGELMVDSHRSLRDDFEVSTEVLDDLVADLCARPGVHGARLTGAGFGGCVVALTEPWVHLAGWRVDAADGARIDRT